MAHVVVVAFKELRFYCALAFAFEVDCVASSCELITTNKTTSTVL
jgi:hypothetical protein